jgi:hypothetical protein
MMLARWISAAALAIALVTGVAAQISMGPSGTPMSPPQNRKNAAQPKPNPAWTPAEQKRLADAMSRMKPKQRKQLAKALKKMTPDQRKQFVALLKQQMNRMPAARNSK